MIPTKEIIYKNLFSMLRKEHFNTDVEVYPMSPWKWRRVEALNNAIAQMEQYDETVAYHLSNRMQEQRRENIFENERHSIDTSIETLKLLNIIIYNVRKIETTGISIPGIITLGKYLRNEGHKVDYVKLDTWIKTLNIKNIASLTASILLQVFHFEASELPFLYKEKKNAQQTLYQQLENYKKENYTALSKNLFKYNKVAYIEYIAKKTRSALANIEE